MSRPVRIGAVGYLNARPLTWALDRSPDRWQVRYDVPSVCAALLHAGDVDLGLIPSIEYLQAPDYRFVPGVGIGSRGPVASVALFTRVPVDRFGAIALDTSSRTSVALVRCCAATAFGIEPAFVPHGPDLAAMTRDARCRAADRRPGARGRPRARSACEKIDLGEAWTAMTGLPFVYAAWTGRPARSTPRTCARCRRRSERASRRPTRSPPSTAPRQTPARDRAGSRVPKG